MPYERLLVRLQRRERQALKDLYDVTSSRLYACLYHELPDDHQCEYVLYLVYEHVWTHPQAYGTEGLFDQLLMHGYDVLQNNTTFTWSPPSLVR